MNNLLIKMKKKSLVSNGNVGKWFAIAASIFVLFIFLALIGFLIYSSIPAFTTYNIFNTLDFNFSDKNASIWMPLSITLLVTVFSVLIATPIGVKTATFIKFRLSDKNSRRCFIIVQTLSGIPSVVFGLFALTSLGNVTRVIFGLSSAYTIINAIIMLSFMILPTIISLTLNTYDGISKEQLLNPISLGLNKTSAIYKIIKKEAFSGIVIAVIIAIGRTIGETMALSMILPNESYSIVSNGIQEILQSNLGTLSSIIATNMFSEVGGPEKRGVLYLFGLVLLILILLLNIFILFLTSKNKRNTKIGMKWKRVEVFIVKIIMFIPNHISLLFNIVIYKDKNINQNQLINTSDFISNRFKSNKFINLKSIVLFWLEIFCTFITMAFLCWITIDVLLSGMIVIFSNENSTIFQYGKNTTGQAFLNTIIIVIISLVAAIPIGLLCAIYLNEFAKETKIKKAILFFIDSIGAAPSIIFGMFGLMVFIRTFGMTSAGSIGRSLIAAAFTISIVILPTMIRMFQQSLLSVPKTTRENGLALGLSKWKVVTKVVLPECYKNIISSIVLTTGRIMSETAPLYLTAGLSGSSQISLLNPGQTLTTRIYAENTASNNLASGLAISYESAFLSLVLILLLIYTGYIIIPNYKYIKQDCINIYLAYRKMYRKQVQIPKDLINRQLINKTLYITYKQSELYNLNRKVDKKIIIDRKRCSIKYLDARILNKMINLRTIYV